MFQRNRSLTALGVFLAISWLMAGPAHAVSIFNSVTVSAGQYSPDAVQSADSSTGAPVSTSLDSDFFIGPNTVISSFSGSAESSSTFGVLRGRVSVSIDNFEPESYTTIGPVCGGPNILCAPGGGPLVDPVSADSFVTDTLLITDPARTGSTGYLGLNFDVTGTTTLSNTQNLDLTFPSAQGILTARVDGASAGSWGFTGDASFTSSIAEFTYGTPFDLRLSSSFFVAPSDYLTNSILPPPLILSPGLQSGEIWDLEATVDFGNSIFLSAISVFDDVNGTQLARGIELSAESGTFYSVSSAPSPVPVPAAAWLFGTALIGLVGIGRRRKIA